MQKNTQQAWIWFPLVTMTTERWNIDSVRPLSSHFSLIWWRFACVMLKYSKLKRIWLSKKLWPVFWSWHSQTAWTARQVLARWWNTIKPTAWKHLQTQQRFPVAQSYKTQYKHKDTKAGVRDDSPKNHFKWKTLLCMAGREWNPELSTITARFPHRAMFVFVDSMRAHYHLAQSASSHSAWTDPISVLTERKYFSWLRPNLWVHMHDLTSASCFSHAEFFPLFR